MVSRRNFLKFGTAAAAAAPFVESRGAQAHEEAMSVKGGVDYSYLSGTEREPTTTTCGLIESSQSSRARPPALVSPLTPALTTLTGRSRRASSSLTWRGKARLSLSPKRPSHGSLSSFLQAGLWICLSR